MLPPYEIDNNRELLEKIFGKIGGNITLLQPIHFDYGKNISVGENFFSNYNLTILDAAKVTIGNNVFIAPNCVITTSGHAIDSKQRDDGLEIALPVTIRADVWIGANVTILPGITIGSNVVIGAGSVVTKDIPLGVIAVGNPCRVLREITEKDQYKYSVYKD